jgi:hypothetical protein
VQKLSIGPIAVLSFIYPVVAILVDYICYGQNLSAGQFGGIALILLGSAGVNLNWVPKLGGWAPRSLRTQPMITAAPGPATTGGPADPTSCR